jgi:hypothetical protein
VDLPHALTGYEPRPATLTFSQTRACSIWRGCCDLPRSFRAEPGRPDCRRRGRQPALRARIDRSGADTRVRRAGVTRVIAWGGPRIPRRSFPVPPGAP